jgi:hypothetical protein
MRFFPSKRKRDRHEREEHGMGLADVAGSRYAGRQFPCGELVDGEPCEFIGASPQGLGAHRRHSHGKKGAAVRTIQRDVASGFLLDQGEAEFVTRYLETWEFEGNSAGDLTEDDLAAVALLRRLKGR